MCQGVAGRRGKRALRGEREIAAVRVAQACPWVAGHPCASATQPLLPFHSTPHTPPPHTTPHTPRSWGGMAGYAGPPQHVPDWRPMEEAQATLNPVG